MTYSSVYAYPWAGENGEHTNLQISLRSRERHPEKAEGDRTEQYWGSERSPQPVVNYFGFPICSIGSPTELITHGLPSADVGRGLTLMPRLMICPFNIQSVMRG